MFWLPVLIVLAIALVGLWVLGRWRGWNGSSFNPDDARGRAEDAAQGDHLRDRHRGRDLPS